VATRFYTRLTRYIRHAFSCSQQQANQLVVLFVFLISSISISVLWSQIKTEIPFLTNFQSDGKQLLEAYRLKLIEDKERFKKQEVILNPTIFNPNEVSEAKMLAMGFPAFLAKTIQNYRSKGGKFRVKSDFKKLYNLREAWYEELAPYVELPDTLAKPTYPENNRNFPVYIAKSKRIHHLFDINEADSSVWEDFSGIGEGMSHRIIEYREKLGGFASIAQVAEVYGLDTNVLCELKPYMQVNAPKLRRININNCSVDDLVKHPYMKYKQAKAIVQYRMQHGNYDQVSSLRFIKSLDWAWIERVSPYLCIKNDDN